MDVHSFNSSPISVEFHMYFDIEEYTKSLMQWARCDDVKISSNAMLAIGKHEECIININPDSVMKDCLRSAYELATLDKNEFITTQENKMEYIKPRLIAIEASLTMVSKYPASGSSKYFWTAVSFLKYTTNESEKITYSSLLLINSILQRSDESEMKHIIDQKPDGFEGFVNLMIDGIFTNDTKALWMNVIESVPNELLIDSCDSPVLELLNATEFPIRLPNKEHKVTISETTKRMRIEDRQRIINFIPSFVATTEKNLKERIPFLHFIAEFINSCLNGDKLVDFSSLDYLGDLVRSEIIKSLTDAHVSLIRAISRAKIGTNEINKSFYINNESSEGKFPFVLVNGEGGAKADTVNYIPAAKSNDVVDEALLIEWEQATTVPSISSILSYNEEDEFKIPEISPADIDNLSRLVLA
jgi:hypothetical protein